MFEPDEQPQELESQDSGDLAPDSPASGDPSPAEQQIVDLDSVEKFKYAGREWTPKEFQGSYMMQADYTRKTQEIAQERKFYDNLDADLERVKSNPDLAEEFKKVYPEKFHRFLGYVESTQPQEQRTQPQQGGLSPEVDKRIKQIESKFQEQEAKATDAQVDAMCTRMAKKYPDVREDFAISELQRILADKRKSEPGYQLTPVDWEKAWKSIEDWIGEKSKTRYSALVKGQQAANQRGKDVASGGGIPGQAPKAPRTIKEASELARQDFAAQN